MNTVPKRLGAALALPFIGLAFIVLLPAAGIVMLSWQGLQAVRTHDY